MRHPLTPAAAQLTNLVMRTRRTMNVSITPELEQLVTNFVASGRNSSASEFVRAALRLFEERERQSERRRATAASGGTNSG